MIIDCHTHINGLKLLKEYEEKLKADYYICIKTFEKDFGDEFYKFAQENKKTYIVEYINWETDIRKQLALIEERMKETNKIKGVKLYPGYQYFYPSDETLYPIYEFAAIKDIPVIFHSGDTLSETTKPMVKYSHPIHIDEIAVKFPETKFVISHLGFPNIMEAGMISVKNENVFTDISGTMDNDTCYRFYKEDIIRLVGYYPSIVNKLMFGTDFAGDDTPLNRVDLYYKLVHEVFTGEDRELILYINAIRVYNI